METQAQRRLPLSSSSATYGAAEPLGVTALVLAGDRPQCKLVSAAGVPCKALLPVAGQPMLARVLDALSKVSRVQRSVVCGPGRIRSELHSEFENVLLNAQSSWFPAERTPATSAFEFLDQYRNQNGGEWQGPVLLTTADHVLLSPEVVNEFLDLATSAQHADADLVVGVADHGQVTAAFPALKKTALRFRGEAYCGCNLFLLKRPPAVRAIEYWRKLESLRKKPLRAAKTIGVGFLLRFGLRRMTLDQVLDYLSAKLSLNAGRVVLSRPEAAVDVDSMEDWEILSATAERRRFQAEGAN